MEPLLKTKQDKEEFLTWIAWLMADVLPQGKESLESREGAYCCLGVACILLIPEEDLVMFSHRIEGGTPNAQNNAPEWLKNIDKHMKEKVGIDPVTLNDTQHKTFPEIGQIIYEAYEEELMAIPD